MSFVPETRPMPPPIPRVSPNDRRKQSTLVHGLASRRVVLDHEDKDAYRDLVRSLAESYRPADALEEHLVVEMAGAMWRTLRARAVEARLLETGGRLDRPAAAPAAAARANDAERLEARRRRPAIDNALVALGGGSYQSYVTALGFLDENLRACWRARISGASNGGETYRPLGDDAQPWRENPASLAAWLRRVRAIDDEIIVEVGGLEAEARAEDRIATAMMTLPYQVVLEHEARLDRHLVRTVETLAKLRRLRARMASENDAENDPDPAGGEAAAPANGDSSRPPAERPAVGPTSAAGPAAASDPRPPRAAPPNRKQRRRWRALERRRRAA